MDKLFTTAEYAGITNTDDGAGGYQLFQSLYTDAQSQFFACTQFRFPSDRNVMVGSWLDGGWGAFMKGATTLAQILQQTGPASPSPNPVREAVAKIWKVYIYMPITDMFGPIPYSEVGTGKAFITYDSQEAIYDDFFTSLAEATTVISQNLDRGTVFEEGDVIYGGDLAKWLKLGNTLRLRAAIRVSLKVPAKAKTEAEAAYAAAGGMITTNDDNAFMQTTPPTYLNPLGVISDWGEFRMSASMQSILQGYADPRLPKYFEPTENNASVWKGDRNGMTIEQMSDSWNSNENNSNVVPRFRNAFNTTEPHGLVMAAETWFLLAEAVVNGYSMGGLTAKECYENGIKASMAQWGVTTGVDAYIASGNTPAALNDHYNTPALSDIPVAFGSTEAVQREQIGTQKWLGLYPSSSPEAWAEFRRTGFPKLYPRLNNDNPDASTDAASVKRCVFPPNESIVNAEGYQSGVTALGGPDKTSTRVWWNQ
ncbi:MAG: SusD/RagB family nutrient-binding outer membrane lipoprotein [Flavitalea sp.]